MTFTQAISSGFRRHRDFKTRSSRSEYWWWSLFAVLASLVATLFDEGLFAGRPILDTILTVVLFLPGIAVGVRRLHDIGKSGWWLLLLVTIIAVSLALHWVFDWSLPILFAVAGIIVMIYWYIQPGTVGANKYGPNPLETATDNVSGGYIEGNDWVFGPSNEEPLCATCGTPLDEDANFCRSCGSAV